MKKLSVVLAFIAMSFVVVAPAAPDDGPVIGTPVAQQVNYDLPSGPTCDVATMEELFVLQVRDEYHVDTIANQGAKIQDLQHELMMNTSKLWDAEWRIKKQAARIKHLRALLGRG